MISANACAACPSVHQCEAVAGGLLCSHCDQTAPATCASGAVWLKALTNRSVRHANRAHVCFGVPGRTNALSPVSAHVPRLARLPVAGLNPASSFR